MIKRFLTNPFIIFIAIMIMYSAGNIIWLVLNSPVIPLGDDSVHFLDIFKSGWLFYNAPLITYIMKFMLFLFGKEYYDLIVVFVNYIFFLIPLYFTYKIAQETCSKETGTIAMLLFAFAPAVYGLSRQYGHQDYHLMAAITFNIYSLIKSNNFKDSKWSVLYGLSVGIGLIIKDAFLAYFFVPFIYSAFIGLKEKPDRYKIINIITAIFIGTLVSCHHYFRDFIILKILYEPVNEPSSLFEYSNFRVITAGLWEELLSPPIFVAFMAGLILFISKYKGKHKNLLLIWFAVPWSIIVLMPHHKLSEYSMGLVPFMAIVGAFFIVSIKNSLIKRTVIVSFIFIAMIQYISFSYGIFGSLFDFSFTYEDKKIVYYDYNNYLIKYNYERRERILNLINRIKNKYSGFTLYYDYTYTVDGIHDSELSYMYLNGMKGRGGIYDDDNITEDIIIITGIPRTEKEISDIVSSRFEDFYNKEKQTANISKNYRYIENNYHVIDEFYISKIRNEHSKITLLGKNDKFAKS